MGSIAESPLNLTHPLFIDYPFLNNKSDFLDIWIIANSRAVISTSTGLDSLACIYKIPQLTVNFLPLTALYSYCNSVSVPKNIFNLEKEKKINLKEYLNLGGKIWPTQSNFDKLPIRISNLTSLELLKATQEFWARIEGTHNSSDTDLILQNKFWTAFKSHPDYKYNHNWKHPKAFVGEDWLRSQEEDFFE
jgi:putative glycosyltransferase (TIGR04372 family)